MTEREDTLLIVEDDALLAAALSAQVRRWGWQPRLATDRKSALAVAPGCEAALIDLGLPPEPHRPVEGLALIEQLAILQPQMLVVVLTGQEEEASALAAIERGAFDFLVKPAHSAHLEQALARARRYGRSQRQLAAEGAPTVHLSAHETRQGMREAVDLAQEKLVRQALAACGGNVAETARRLGVERPRLYYYLDKFGIVRGHDG